MKNEKREFASIDEYIQTFPEHIRRKLIEVREIIRKEAPLAAEKISYQMPTFYLNGNLVHFAGYEKHIGFYPASSGIEAFKSEIAQYKSGKGSVQFPLDEPLPIELIKKIIRFRVRERLGGGEK